MNMHFVVQTGWRAGIGTLEKSELQSKLNIKNAEIEVAKRDLEEAHEMAGVLFLEAMAVTDSYNELKKQCKKVKR